MSTVSRRLFQGHRWLAWLTGILMTFILWLAGITGYWQTSGRNQTTFAARAEFDPVYEEGLALSTDLRILLRTVSVVVKGTGC